MFSLSREDVAVDIRRLRAARKAKGLTQAQVASLVGIRQQSYYLYESGKQDPKSDVLACLCTALDVSADYLLGLDVRESSLTDDEIDLISDFRSCDRKWQLIVLETAHAAALSAAEGTDAGEGDAEGIA